MRDAFEELIQLLDSFAHEKAKIATRDNGPADTHLHECANLNCRNVWRHGDDTIDKPYEEFQAAHKCPKCGTSQIYKYFGTRRPEGEVSGESKSRRRRSAA